ncbi:MAG: UvrD-helicase domain-containing protein [Desulfovibrio sp.]|nr:UvrD-helicase domain-containing protein [Desulfovibrio sp.]
MHGLYQIKASAGSGKTYTLTRRFLDLLEKKNPLNSIVAITFTNAAAEEMRSRILLQLKKNALDRTLKEEKRRQSLSLLRNILYNYTALNVRTIDSLLLHIVRTAALSLSLDPDFEPVFSEKETVLPCLEILAGKALRGDDELAALFTHVMSCLYEEGDAEGFRARTKLENLLTPLFSAILLKKCEALSPSTLVRDAYRGKKETVRECAESLLEAGEGFPWLANAKKALLPLADGTRTSSSSVYLSKTSVAELFSKNAHIDADLLQPEYERLKASLAAVLRLKNAVGTMPFIELGKRMVCEFERGENAAASLHTAVIPMLVRAIFDGILEVNETLFRLGNRTKHLLIDEFQDTDDGQWAALQDLVVNTLALGGSFTWVGDIKQSIYGWRGANPELFDGLLDMDILTDLAEKKDVHREVLPYNWRSRKAIVDFNNALYAPFENETSVHEVFTKALPKETPVTEAYMSRSVVRTLKTFSQAKQDLPPCNDAQEEGFVELFETEREEAAPVLAERILKIHERRAWSEILVVVRRNSECQSLAETLLEGGVPVVTENSLLLAKQGVIIESIALIRFLLWHEETSLAILLAGRILDLQAVDDTFSQDALFTGSLERRKPLEETFIELWPDLWKRFFLPYLDAATLHSPYDLISEWYNVLQVETRFPESIVFFRRFREVLHRAEEEQCATLSSFLEYWNSCNGDEKVPMPENMDAVRIMTVHKAKGLEAPVVFFPWEMPTVKTQERLLFEEHGGLHLALRMKKETVDAYSTSYMKVLEEAVNILYVATTRAREELYVQRIRSRNDAKDLLLNLCEEAGIVFPSSYGREPAGTRVALDEPETPPTPPLQPSLPPEEKPLSWLPALKILHAPLSSRRAKALDMGLLLHRALELINPEEAVQKSVEEAVSTAIRTIGCERLVSREARDRLFRAVAWFLEQKESRIWLAKGLREHALLDENGSMLRCDLLVPCRDHLLVVDYKSGAPQNEDVKQVRRYMKALAQAGARARAVLVYLEMERFRLIEEKKEYGLRQTFA